MPVLISDALGEARAMLNDVASALYTNTVLLPYIRKAYQEFESWGDSYNLYIVKRQTTDLVPTTISGNYTILNYISSTPTLPADLRIPIRIREKLISEPRSAYSQLEETEFSKIIDVSVTREIFGYWNFDGNAIYLPKLTVPGTRNIEIDYIGSTITFTDQTSTVFDVHFRQNLAARTAALAAMYIGQNESRAMACQTDADGALDRIIEVMVRKQQGTFGSRRVPFGMRRRVRDAYNKWWA